MLKKKYILRMPLCSKELKKCSQIIQMWICPHFENRNGEKFSQEVKAPSNAGILAVQMCKESHRTEIWRENAYRLIHSPIGLMISSWIFLFKFYTF